MHTPAAQFLGHATQSRFRLRQVQFDQARAMSIWSRGGDLTLDISPADSRTAASDWIVLAGMRRVMPDEIANNRLGIVAD